MEDPRILLRSMDLKGLMAKVFVTEEGVRVVIRRADVVIVSTTIGVYPNVTGFDDELQNDLDAMALVMIAMQEWNRKHNPKVFERSITDCMFDVLLEPPPFYAGYKTVPTLH